MQLNAQKMVAVDQDHDGIPDIAMYRYDPVGGEGGVAVLYGRKNALPDTNDFETVQGGFLQAALLTDVTGDSIPELMITSSQVTSVYIGLPGQRLLEQYGSGNDPPHLDSTRWWGRPWSSIKGPRLLDDGWASDGGLMLECGDWDGDSVGDILEFSWPDLILYHTADRFDQLIDASIDMRPVSHWVDDAWSRGGTALLGDIDASGEPALRFWAQDGVVYLKPIHPDFYSGSWVRLPEGTGRGSAALVPATHDGSELHLRATPNPSGSEILLRWRATAEQSGMLRITTADGEIVLTHPIAAGEQEFRWRCGVLPSGSYFAIVRTPRQTATIAISIVR